MHNNSLIATVNESVCSILDERDEIELVEFRISVAVFYRHAQLKKSKQISIQNLTHPNR